MNILAPEQPDGIAPPEPMVLGCLNQRIECCSVFRYRSFRVVTSIVVSLVGILLFGSDMVANKVRYMRPARAVERKSGYNDSQSSIAVEKEESMSKDASQTDNRPYFVLHVGPQKTGK
jgi:hypothetical protein